MNHPQLDYLDMLTVLRNIRNSYQHCYGLAVDAGFIPTKYLANHPKIYKDEISRFSSKNKLTDYLISDFIPIVGIESFSFLQISHHFDDHSCRLTSEYDPCRLLSKSNLFVSTNKNSKQLTYTANTANYSFYSLEKTWVNNSEGS